MLGKSLPEFEIATVTCNGARGFALSPYGLGRITGESLTNTIALLHRLVARLQGAAAKLEAYATVLLVSHQQHVEEDETWRNVHERSALEELLVRAPHHVRQDKNFGLSPATASNGASTNAPARKSASGIASRSTSPPTDTHELLLTAQSAVARHSVSWGES